MLRAKLALATGEAFPGGGILLERITVFFLPKVASDDGRH
jgi:hypothetical protein